LTSEKSATAFANPNIAFIKYWGNKDPYLRLPSNGSISMNLGGLKSRTQIVFDPVFQADNLFINGRPHNGQPLQRVSAFLDIVRKMSGMSHFARVESSNNFPTGTGIASSASGFAALALAAATTAGLILDEKQLSQLARRGSGSACRSIPTGFVEWYAGEDDDSSYAQSIAPPEHWALNDCVAIVSKEHKPVGSGEGHAMAGSSPLQKVRVADAPQRLDLCRRAILERDFEVLAEVAELDSNLMHAAIMTSSPPVLYWQPGTIAVMRAVQDWRKAGMPVFFTIDAGPNVHVICPTNYATKVTPKLNEIPGVMETLCAPVGGPARLEAQET
jgi:diphosphomevalonate decarboxylase